MVGDLELSAVPARTGFGTGSFLLLVLYFHLERIILGRFQFM